jgi:CheY-like chemotaxis protein
MSASKILRAFTARTSVFNKFTREKERSIAAMRLAVAEMVSDDNLLFAGFCGHLIPRSISHVLRVCLIADIKFRIAGAGREQSLSAKEAARAISNYDCSVWIEAIFNRSDPWDAELYDIVIPVDKASIADAAALIADNAASDILQPTGNSMQVVADFGLAARTEAALAGEGHHVAVSASGGCVTLTINKHVLMLSRLEEELTALAMKVPGVSSIKTKVGKDFHRTDIYRKHDFEVPSKVLLVDDEREFIQTLSERLMMRDMGSVVAYDGESALNLIKEDEPDVMIVDLKMPGIDGVEVLRQVKETRPEIEVIILTGHGHEEDRDVCMQLGAFAYLQKPLDINVLSETIKKANAKIRQRKGKKD